MKKFYLVAVIVKFLLLYAALAYQHGIITRQARLILILSETYPIDYRTETGTK